MQWACWRWPWRWPRRARPRSSCGREVGNVNTKVDTLSGSLEETQERTRKNEERIGTVDQKAEAAGRSAQDARGAADAAAQSAHQVNTRVDQVQTELNNSVAASRKLVFEVTLSEDQGQFKIGQDRAAGSGAGASG